MTKINEEDHPPIGSVEYTGTLYAVHRDGDTNIWYCPKHEFEGHKDVCERCGQDASHSVHDVRAYGILLPKP
jgi:hypothetical protein